MADGVKNYVDISGTKGFSVRVWYQETYDVATNKSSVAITNVYVKSSDWYTTYYLHGSITVDGITAVSMRSDLGTHNVTLLKLGVWYEVVGTLGSVSDIVHNDNGSKTITISVNVTGYTGGSGVGNGWNVSGSQAVALTTIARKSTLTASNGTLGTAQTLTISRQSSSFAHSIRYVCGNVDIEVCTKVTDTSISFIPPLNLAKQNTTGTSVKITFTLYTFESTANNATEIGRTTTTITCAIPSSVKPSCSVAVTDVLGHVSKYGGYIQGQSRLEVVVTPELAYDSPISNYSVTADGKTYGYSDVEIAPITGSGNLAISAIVTDKRSRFGTASKTINVLPYTTPAISKLTVHRCNADGTENQTGEYTLVTYSLAITSLSNINSKAISLKYKKTSDANYTTVTLPAVYTATDATYIFGAVADSSYDVVIVATDDFAEISRSTSVSTAACFMDWDYENDSVSFGKIASKEKTLECAWTMYDKFDTLIGNGLAAYTGGGDSGIDPNTTIEELCLTSHTNAPQGLGTFYYIRTVFYNTKSETAARSQFAIPYNKAGSIYHRYYVSGSWSSWRRTVNADENASPIRVNSLNEVVSPGWYVMWFEPSDLPAGTTNGTKYIHVTDFCDANNLVIELHINNSWTDYSILTPIIRRKYNGVWQPWEWDKPNMNVGVEYRTTERHQGKPVYTMLVNLSTLPNATTKTVAHGAAATAILRVCGVTSTGTTIPYRSGDSIGTIAANNTQIVVHYTYNASSATAYAQIWYTKD